MDILIKTSERFCRTMRKYSLSEKAISYTKQVHSEYSEPEGFSAETVLTAGSC